MLSLCPQSQAVSDGGKSEKASFFLEEVCVSEYIRVSLSLRCSSLPLGLQSWTCLQELPVEATTPVFQALRVERRAPPTESWAGLSHSKVCWRIPAASIILLWAVYSRCLLLFRFSGVYVCSYCFSLCRTSWNLRWAQRTFYSGKLVRSSRRSLLPLWMRWDGPSLCKSVHDIGASQFFNFIKRHYERKHLIIISIWAQSMSNVDRVATKHLHQIISNR